MQRKRNKEQEEMKKRQIEIKEMLLMEVTQV